MLHHNRHVRDIIPYQELLGNYNRTVKLVQTRPIIPYQELLGNYNLDCFDRYNNGIIPYQELLGNYNLITGYVLKIKLYHTKNC